MLRSLSSSSSLLSRASPSLQSTKNSIGSIRTLIYSRKTKEERQKAKAASEALQEKTSTEESFHVKYHPVEIHPLSQMVLQYLQDYKSDWLVERGLDRGLCINGDGTIKITFPPSSSTEDDDDDDFEEDGGRIWTSYDHIKKQHFISVHRHNLLLGRFMLRHVNCNGLSNPCSGLSSFDCDESSPREQVRDAVEKMIQRIGVLEKKKKKDRVGGTTTA